MQPLIKAQQTHVDKVLANGRARYYRDGSASGFTHGLFWQVGTGKTASAARMYENAQAFLRQVGDNRHKLPGLIVCPASVKTQWREEIYQFTDIDWLDTLIFEGDPATREKYKAFIKAMGPLVITNYEMLTAEQQFFQEQKWLALILDESHYIKNNEAQRSRAAMSVDAEFVLLLSGTPITSRPDGLYNQLKRMDPGDPYYREWGKPAVPSARCPIKQAKELYYKLERVSYGKYREASRKVDQQVAEMFGGRPMSRYNLPPLRDNCDGCPYYHGENRYVGSCEFGGNVRGIEPFKIRYRGSSPTWGTQDAFESRYCMYEYTRFGKKFTGAKNQLELHRRLFDSDIASRVLRSDVADLAAPTYRYIPLDLEDDQAALYRQVASGIVTKLNMVGEMTEVQLRSHLTIMLYLERAAAMTPKDFQESIADAPPEWLHITKQKSDKGAKQNWLLDFMDELDDGDKVIVFSQWLGVIEPLQKMLEEHGVFEPLAFHGKMTDQQKDVARHLFNRSKEHKIIIVSPAGFQGINLQKGVDEDGTLHIVFFDFGWNPERIVQPIARGHRLGLKGKLWIWFLRAVGTIDDYKVKRLKNKQRDIDLIIEGRSTAMIDLFDADAGLSKARLLEMV